MSAESALALAAGLAEVLGAIHAASVVHCDLKPTNVLPSQDGPRVRSGGPAISSAWAPSSPSPPPARGPSVKGRVPDRGFRAGRSGPQARDLPCPRPGPLRGRWLRARPHHRATTRGRSRPRSAGRRSRSGHRRPSRPRAMPPRAPPRLSRRLRRRPRARPARLRARHRPGQLGCRCRG
jgi:serine/threonine protein kinase